MDLLLPVCVEKYPLPRLYAHLVHVDLCGVGETEKTRRLLDAVGYRGKIQIETAKTAPQDSKDRHLAEKFYQLGEMYNYGIGVEQDYDRARLYYEKAAEKGYELALRTLGWYY